MRISLCLLVVASLALAACSKKPDSTPKVTIALNWVPEPEFGGIYAARAIGAFSKHGLDPAIQGGGAGAPVIQRVAAGQVEFGIASADEVIMARAAGADVVSIFAIYQTCPQGIMVHKSRGHKDIADVLKGGSLAVEPGLPYVKYLQAKYPASGVKLIPYTGGIAQFLTDKDLAQQCFIFSEPIAARRQGADPQVFLVSEAGYNPYTAVVVTSGAHLKKSPQICKAMVAALQEGWRAYLDDPGPANAEMGKLNKSMDAQTFAEAAEAQKPLVETAETKANGLGTMTAARWQVLVDQLRELKLLDKPVNAQDCMAELGK